MSDNLIQFKTFLGKYYSDLLSSASQPKYKDSGLCTLFEQRFLIQNNKVQMIIEADMSGLSVLVSGNEIRVSKELFNHPNIVISNSMEDSNALLPKNMYNPDNFSTIAYLMCQNQTSFHITGEVDEPIYIKYKGNYEAFYSSVISVNISPDISVEVIEEIHSCCALNSVINYLVGPNAKLDLTTFYKNTLVSLSYTFRSLLLQDSAIFNHTLFGKGSESIVDENYIYAMHKSKSTLTGIIDSCGKKFQSVMSVEPLTETYDVNVDYRSIVYEDAYTNFCPISTGYLPVSSCAIVDLSRITLEDIPADQIDTEITNFISDIVSVATLERMVGVKRYYDNKAKFLQIYK